MNKTSTFGGGGRGGVERSCGSMKYAVLGSATMSPSIDFLGQELLYSDIL